MNTLDKIINNGLKELAAYEQGGESRQLVRLNTGDKIHVGGIYLNGDNEIIYIKTYMKYLDGRKTSFPYKALYSENIYTEAGHYCGVDEVKKNLVYEIRGEFAKELLAAGFFKNL